MGKNLFHYPDQLHMKIFGIINCKQGCNFRVWECENVMPEILKLLFCLAIFPTKDELRRAHVWQFINQ